MAGHSKWANTKHRKERADKIKGKIFSKIAKEIISSVKEGGNDPKSNTRLRVAIQKAKDANMPNENIERNIKKAASDDQSGYTEIVYELYGHGGVGIIVEAMTDNKNRTASDLRIATNKCGGTIASPGAVVYNFEKKGVLPVPRELIEEGKLFEMATNFGADEFEVTEEAYILLTPPDQVYAIKEKLEKQGLSSIEADLEMVPKVVINVTDEGIQANMKLIDWLENLDDVDRVFHNMSSETTV